MRTERVFTNYRCNQACAYCTFRRPDDDLAAIQPGVVRAAIDRALAQGAKEIVLTGGEPTLRADIALLVAHAARDGVEVVLETNATEIDDALATRLREAGLARAVVNLAGLGSALDAVTRDPGGFERTLRGVEALFSRGITVEIQAAIVRSTVHEIVALVSRVSALGAAALIVAVPTESPEPAELLGWDEACDAVRRVELAARGVGLPVRFATDAAPPPCAFPPGARVQHLYSSLTPGAGRREGYRHVAECEACLVRTGCAGIADSYLARHPRPTLHAIAEERVRRRLSLVSTVAEQVRRELVSPSRAVDPVRGLTLESIVRVNFHCNQSCTFCFVSTHLPSPGEDVVRAAIEDAARRGTKVILSGGEPTLNPALADYIRLAKSLSKMPVQLQTNAVRLDDPSIVLALVEAGLDEAFVSLHGATAEVSDRVTETPGTFVRTRAGIDELAKTKILVVINFVLCRTNFLEATAFVRLVAERWPKALVNFSFVAPSSDLVPRTTALIPRYVEVLPHLAEAMQLARDRGLRVVGLESMCGLPLCLVPGSVRDLALAEIPEGFDAGEFIKGAACQDCALETRCHGLRRGYAAMYGEGELRAIGLGDELRGGHSAIS
jgi:MoaA/NifB/PqqE/SkfB family radical SAM enzyme